MRKITTKNDEAKRKKKNQIIVGIILVLVMFFSVIGYGFMGKEDNEESKNFVYNGFEFINYQGTWRLEIGNYQFAFKYNPNQVEKINNDLETLQHYSGKPLYISSENNEAEFEIYRNLDKIILRRQYACLEGQECEEDLPIKTCKDNFIIIREAPIANIMQEENCVFISGPQENITRTTDEFLFKIIGVE